MENSHLNEQQQLAVNSTEGNVRVIAGDFKGVVGKVARIAGQQRIVVEISGLCLVATAYIPTDFIEIVK